MSLIVAPGEGGRRTILVAFQENLGRTILRDRLESFFSFQILPLPRTRRSLTDLARSDDIVIRLDRLAGHLRAFGAAPIKQQTGATPARRVT
jgi:hypothetical protein